jgi:hypothetical protein
MIVQYAGLMFDEREDVIVIKRKGDKESKIQEEYYASVNSREINISAVFFEMDVNMARKIGLGLEILLQERF